MGEACVKFHVAYKSLSYTHIRKTFLFGKHKTGVGGAGHLVVLRNIRKIEAFFSNVFSFSSFVFFLLSFQESLLDSVKPQSYILNDFNGLRYLKHFKYFPVNLPESTVTRI